MEWKFRPTDLESRVTGHFGAVNEVLKGRQHVQVPVIVGLYSEYTLKSSTVASSVSSMMTPDTGSRQVVGVERAPVNEFPTHLRRVTDNNSCHSSVFNVHRPLAFSFCRNISSSVSFSSHI